MPTRALSRIHEVVLHNPEGLRNTTEFTRRPARRYSVCSNYFVSWIPDNYYGNDDVKGLMLCTSGLCVGTLLDTLLGTLLCTLLELWQESKWRRTNAVQRISSNDPIRGSSTTGFRALLLRYTTRKESRIHLAQPINC